MAARDYVDVLIAVITGGAAWWGIKVSLRRYRDDANSNQNARSMGFSQGLAEQAFHSVQNQVKDFVEQQKLWQDERATMAAHIDNLVSEVHTLNKRVNTTNQYLHAVLIVLDQHDITYPPMPPDLL